MLAALDQAESETEFIGPPLKTEAAAEDENNEADMAELLEPNKGISGDLGKVNVKFDKGKAKSHAIERDDSMGFWQAQQDDRNQRVPSR